MDMAVKRGTEPIEILLVEDNPGDVRLTVEALKQSKLLNRLHIVNDGVEAMRFLHRVDPYHDAVRPDVILLDLNLPKKSGHEVLAEIKRDPLLRRIPVAIVTGSTLESDVARAYESHANCYITKPVDMSQFLQVVQSFEEFWVNVVKLPRLGEVHEYTSVRVLLVEDNAPYARLVSEFLSEDRPNVFEIEHVDRLEIALTRLEEKNIDVVLLDLGLPDSSGLDTVRRVRRGAPYVPIVVLSGQDDQELAIEAVRCGAQDFLTKGVHDTEVLRRSLRYAIERRRAEERLDYLATHDDLTDLPNRMLLMENARQVFVQAGRRNRLGALMLLDLDNLKRVNETLGHGVGDEIIRITARRLSRSVRKDDTVARLGGDEFGILLADLAAEQHAMTVAQKILAVMAEPYVTNGHELNMTVSIGAALYPQNGAEPELLLKNADVALYRAKEEGRNSYQFYSSQMNERAQERLALETALHHAIERGECRVHYQPVLRLVDLTIVAHEALMRWQHPQRGLLPPAEFIPMAEENGLIVPLGAWVLENACRQTLAWGQNLTIAVNLSARQVNQTNIVDTVLDALERTALNAQSLELELTESIMQNAQAAAKLFALKQAGVRVALDDFGTGYSSFDYLKRFPIDTLKIERAFVAGIGKDRRDEAIIKTIIEMAHRLGMTATAEGVETEEQLKFLQTERCDLAQGYYFSPPVPAENAQSLLAHGLARL